MCNAVVFVCCKTLKTKMAQKQRGFNFNKSHCFREALLTKQTSFMRSQQLDSKVITGFH